MDKLQKMVESRGALFLARILVPMMLTLFGFLGLQVWNDIRAVGETVVGIRIDLARITESLKEFDRRLQQLEEWRRSDEKR